MSKGIITLLIVGAAIVHVIGMCIAYGFTKHRIETRPKEFGINFEGFGTLILTMYTLAWELVLVLIILGAIGKTIGILFRFLAGIGEKLSEKF